MGFVIHQRSAVSKMQETIALFSFYNQGKRQNKTKPSNVSHPSKVISHSQNWNQWLQAHGPTDLIRYNAQQPCIFQKRKVQEGIYMSRNRRAIHIALNKFQPIFAAGLLYSAVFLCPEDSFITDPQPHLHDINNSSHNDEELMATNSPSMVSVTFNLLLFS